MIDDIQRDFDSLDSRVAPARREYIEFLENLPSVFSQAGKLHLQLRENQRNGVSCTCHYLPYWLAEPYKISDESVIGRVAAVHFFTYEWVTLQDDAADLPTPHARSWTMLSGIIWAEITRMIAELKTADDVLFGRLSQYVAEWLSAEIHLGTHGGYPTPYNHEDFLACGRKAAMIKLPVAVYAGMNSSVGEMLARLEEALDLLGVGWQIHDDLQDWDEDLRAQRWTYPLWVASEKMKRQSTRGCSMRTMKEALFDPDVLHDIVVKSTEYFKDARACLLEARARHFVEYLDGVLEQNKLLQAELQWVGRQDAPQRVRDLEKHVAIRLQGTS